jgi:hypothetical protein
MSYELCEPATGIPPRRLRLTAPPLVLRRRNPEATPALAMIQDDAGGGAFCLAHLRCAHVVGSKHPSTRRHFLLCDALADRAVGLATERTCPISLRCFPRGATRPQRRK